MHTQWRTLPAKLRRRAERFLSADLRSVRFRIDCLPRRFGACACTIGDRIHLAPEVMAEPKAARERIFVHELAHVLQQRRPPASPPTYLNHSAPPGGTNRLLEWEAQAAEREFARGSARLSFPLSSRMPGDTSALTYVSIDGATLSSERDISEKCRLLLGAVQGGLNWLYWAIDRQDRMFEFKSESQLADAVQIGLHGTDLLLLKPLELLAVPSRLSELDVSDIKLLLKSRPDDFDPFDPSGSLGRILQTNELRPQASLIAARDFLNQLGIANNGLFQAMTLGQWSDLYTLAIAGAPGSTLTLPKKKEAGSFAIAQAQTPHEFIDLYLYYVWFLDKLGSAKQNAEQRQTLANGLLQSISTALYPHQDCLVVNSPPNSTELQGLLQSYIDAGGKLGFTRLSLGASEVMRESPDSIIEPDGETYVLSSQYFEDAQTFVRNNPYGSVIPAQDGSVWRFYINTATASATIELDTNGYLTLHSYTPPAN